MCLWFEFGILKLFRFKIDVYACVRVPIEYLCAPWNTQVFNAWCNLAINKIHLETEWLWRVTCKFQRNFRIWKEKYQNETETISETQNQRSTWEPRKKNNSEPNGTWHFTHPIYFIILHYFTASSLFYCLQSFRLLLILLVWIYLSIWKERSRFVWILAFGLVVAIDDFGRKISLVLLKMWLKSGLMICSKLDPRVKLQKIRSFLYWNKVIVSEEVWYFKRGVKKCSSQIQIAN